MGKPAPALTIQGRGSRKKASNQASKKKRVLPIEARYTVAGTAETGAEKKDYGKKRRKTRKMGEKKPKETTRQLRE